MIYLSLLSALLHAGIEFILMKLESSALKTKIMHYTIVCLNARSGWIPYDHMLGSSLGLSTKDVLDYSNIENTCFRMAFHFNN